MAFWKPSSPNITAAQPAKPKAVQPAPRKPLNTGLELQEKSGVDRAESSKGFDPYNSGAFNRKDTWSRVVRK